MYFQKEGFKNLNTLMKGVLNPLLAKRGFGNTRILEDWNRIIGEKYAPSVLPDKILFPREQGKPGTLYVLVADTSTGAAFQYLQPLVIERINSYFGYQAISNIVMTLGQFYQKKISTPKLARTIETLPEDITEPLHAIKDPLLSEALEKLGSSLYSRT
jgi:hypothetical protein